MMIASKVSLAGGLLRESVRVSGQRGFTQLSQVIRMLNLKSAFHQFFTLLLAYILHL